METLTGTAGPMLLLALLLVLPFASLCALLIWQMCRMQTRWMRLFSESSLKTNPAIMEDKAALEEVLPLPLAPRKRISVPLPGASLFKRPPSAH